MYFLLINIEPKEHQQKKMRNQKKTKAMSMSFIIFTSALHFHPKIIQHFFLYSKTPPIVIRTFLSLVSKKNDGSALWVFHKNVPTKKKWDITKINCWEKFNIFSEPTIKEVEKGGKEK